MDGGDVKAATDLALLIGEHVALKLRGRDLIGRCPFHGEKTPSFVVHPDRGFFRCFGCNAGGDSITFIQRLTGGSFREAHLAKGVGIRPRQLAPAAVRREITENVRCQRERLLTDDNLRKRWRTAIYRHDDLEGLCFALGVAERCDPERQQQLTQDLFTRYGCAISPRTKVERELDAIEAEERTLQEQPVHKSWQRAVAAGGA